MTAPFESQRTITDAQELRALSHPVRLALLHALMDGPLTATQAGEIIGETPTTCSFHLRQLARYGFVEEAGGGRGRNRPWRRIHHGWRAPAQPANPEFTAASQTLDRILLDWLTSRMRRFIEDAASFPAAWQEAAIGNQNLYHMTAGELAEFVAEQEALHRRYRERYDERRVDPAKRPAGSLPVEIVTAAYPIEQPS